MVNSFLSYLTGKAHATDPNVHTTTSSQLVKVGDISAAKDLWNIRVAASVSRVLYCLERPKRACDLVSISPIMYCFLSHHSSSLIHY